MPYPTCPAPAWSQFAAGEVGEPKVVSTWFSPATVLDAPQPIVKVGQRWRYNGEKIGTVATVGEEYAEIKYSSGATTYMDLRNERPEVKGWELVEGKPVAPEWAKVGKRVLWKAKKTLKGIIVDVDAEMRNPNCWGIRVKWDERPGHPEHTVWSLDFELEPDSVQFYDKAFFYVNGHQVTEVRDVRYESEKEPPMLASVEVGQTWALVDASGKETDRGVVKSVLYDEVTFTDGDVASRSDMVSCQNVIDDNGNMWRFISHATPKAQRVEVGQVWEDVADGLRLRVSRVSEHYATDDETGYRLRLVDGAPVGNNRLIEPATKSTPVKVEVGQVWEWTNVQGSAHEAFTVDRIDDAKAYQPDGYGFLLESMRAGMSACGSTRYRLISPAPAAPTLRQEALYAQGEHLRYVANELGVPGVWPHETDEALRARILAKISAEAPGPGCAVRIDRPITSKTRLSEIKQRLNIPLSAREQREANKRTAQAWEPPRWALDGRGRRSGEDWELYQRALCLLTENANLGNEPVVFRPGQHQLLAAKDLAASVVNGVPWHESEHTYVPTHKLWARR